MLPDEAIILNTKTWNYYGASETAAVVWSALRQGAVKVADVCDIIAREYDVDRRRCETDIVEFLSDLLEHGLVEVC